MVASAPRGRAHDVVIVDDVDSQKMEIIGVCKVRGEDGDVIAEARRVLRVPHAFSVSSYVYLTTYNNILGVGRIHSVVVS